MKNKKTLTSLALSATLLIGCTTITPKAGFELAYVPERNNGRSYSNELMTDVSIGAEASLNNLNFEIGGNSRTFVNPGLPIMKKINWQEYGIYGQVETELNKNLHITFFIDHLCSHLIDEQSFNASQYMIFPDGINIYPDKKVFFGLYSLSKMGIKIEAKMK